ncbi:MAG: DUF488 domain-containing protein [Bacteroidetes bacterium]|nr:MAG: DUF488 domain-containing protein [Bacteroidota bacterium]
MEFFTIGVYNSTEEDFFKKLTDNRIDTFCDIRQRRAVRGSKYAFVNSNRLQARLAELDIKYGHVLKLAPPVEIRELQKQADLDKGELKRDRQFLGQVFTSEYKNRILDNFDFDNLIETLENNGASRCVLFCVEERPEACHRSLVSQVLQDKYHYKVTNL